MKVLLGKRFSSGINKLKLPTLLLNLVTLVADFWFMEPLTTKILDKLKPLVSLSVLIFPICICNSVLELNNPTAMIVITNLGLLMVNYLLIVFWVKKSPM